MTPRRSLTTTLALAVALGAPAVPALAAPATAAASSLDLTDEQESLLAQFEAAWADSALVEDLHEQFGIEGGHLIDGSQYDCAKTELNVWLDEQRAD